MAEFWLKMKMWFKVGTTVLVVVYSQLFFLINAGTRVDLWVFPWREPIKPAVLMLVFVTFSIGVVGTLLVRTTIKTVRQVRGMRERGRGERLADMQAKAARLQVRPSGVAPAAVPLSPPVMAPPPPPPPPPAPAQLPPAPPAEPPDPGL